MVERFMRSGNVRNARGLLPLSAPLENRSREPTLVEAKPENRRREEDQGGESTSECGHPQ